MILYVQAVEGVVFCRCVCVCGGSNGLSSIDGSMAAKSSPDKTIRHRKHSGCCRPAGLIPDELTFHIRSVTRPFPLLTTTSDEEENNHAVLRSPLPHANTLLVVTVSMLALPDCTNRILIV